MPRRYTLDKIIDMPIVFAEAIRKYVSSSQNKLERKHKGGEKYSKYTPRKHGYQAILFCEFLVKNGVNSFQEIGQTIIDQYADEHSRKSAQKAMSFLRFFSYNYPSLLKLQSPLFRRPAARLMCEPEEVVENILLKTGNIPNNEIKVYILFLALYAQPLAKSAKLKMSSIKAINGDLFVTFHKHSIRVDQETKEAILACHPKLLNANLQLEDKAILSKSAIDKIKPYLNGANPRKIRNSALVNIIKAQRTHSLSALTEALDVSMPTLIWLAQSISIYHFDR